MNRTSQQRADTAIAYAAIWLIVLLLVVLGLGQLYFNDWHSPLPRKLFISFAILSGILWLWQHRLVATHRAPRLRLLLALALVPMALVMAWGWMWLMPPLAVSAVVLAGGRWKWLASGLLILGVGTASALGEDSMVLTFMCMGTSALMAGVLVIFTRMLLVVQELALTREQVARLRVDEERLRIQRDLHDLLGRTLVTVSMRTQTALRLLDKDLEAVRSQLKETGELVSSGQAQLRELVAGRTVVDLAQELDSAQDLCGRLGIRLELRRELISDPSSDALAARILREAMTNMLKHSRPARATIEVLDEQGCTVVTVVNDGAVGLPQHPARGTGLKDLRDRLENHLGGTLVAGPEPGGHFRVQARIPRSVAAGRHLGDRPTPDPD